MNATSKTCDACADNCLSCDTAGAGKCDTCAANYVVDATSAKTCGCGLCAGVECGAHGSCTSGECVCTDGYTGAACATPPATTNSTGSGSGSGTGEGSSATTADTLGAATQTAAPRAALALAVGVAAALACCV